MGKLKLKGPETKETKGTNADATATTKAKGTKSAKETLKDAATAVIANKALTEVKYIYPTDKVTPAERKAFRSEVRRKIASYTKKIDALRTQDNKEAKALLKENIAGYNTLIQVRKDLKPIK